MRIAVLSSCTVVVAVSAGFACGNNIGTPSDPLNTRETPTSGTDRAPTSTDPPPSGYEAPPSGYDTPPAAGDPANQAGGGTCVPCSGAYTCEETASEGGSSQTETVSITLAPSADSSCTVSGLQGSDSASASEFPACGTAALADLDALTAIQFSRVGAGFKACVTVDAGSTPFSGCITCTPGGSGGTASSTSVTISGSGSSNGGGSGCGALSSCCSALASAEQSGCNSLVSLGNASDCSTALAGYQADNLCP